jgi:hypothetical protein
LAGVITVETLPNFKLWDVFNNLRARDREELEASGYADRFDAYAAWHQIEMTEGQSYGALFLWRGRPAAALLFVALNSSTLSAGLLATDDWPHVARSVYRWGVREFRPMLLELGFRRAECRTIAGHEDAIHLLERLGFTLECRCPLYGVGGQTFLQYAYCAYDKGLRDVSIQGA